jgi:hypothetical protein
MMILSQYHIFELDTINIYSAEDGGRRIFLKTFCASLFNEDLWNEPNFSRIHLAGQYL